VAFNNGDLVMPIKSNQTHFLGRMPLTDFHTFGNWPQGMRTDEYGKLDIGISCVEI
jgi:hypothetical protein